MNNSNRSNERPKMDNKKLITEQVKGLQKRTKAAIKSSTSALTPSLAFEYAKLLGNASILSLSNDQLSYELSLLKTESATIPSKSKDDPLIQLKWLDNSISKLRILVRRLSPDIEMELKLHPRVLNVSEKLFENGHYPQAVFEALKSLEEYVKEKSGIRGKSGKKLMGYVLMRRDLSLR